MENNKMEDSEKKVRKPKSSDYYEQLLQSEFNHKEFVGEFKYPLEAREIIVRKTSKLIKLKIRMTESPRVHRRPVCLSQATLPDSFKLS